MKEIATENQVFQEEAHRLSFSDLPITLISPTTPSARPDLLFEFSAAAHPTVAHSYFNDVVFCGKIIRGDDEDDHHDGDLNEYQKRDYFATVKSESSPKPYSPKIRGQSGEIARPNPKCSDLDYHAQRVNITSLTSMSAKSRRRMFMFGMVKFKPEMELSAIKQRQAKLAAAAGSGGKKGGSQWGILKSTLRGRSHLTSVLARSLGCIPLAGGGSVGRRLAAAN